MRKVYIQKENGEMVNENAYVAYYGFNKIAARWAELTDTVDEMQLVDACEILFV